MQRVHGALAHLFAGLLVIQFFLAGLGTFETVNDKHFRDSNFDPHIALGNVLVLLALIIAAIALIGRWSPFVTRLSLLLFGLMVIQSLLGGLGADNSAWFGALHAVNALLIVGVTIGLIRESRHVQAQVETHTQTE